MDFFVTYKWLFLLIGEIVFTVCVVGFIVLRYWFGLARLSMVAVVVFVLNDVWLLLLAILDYQHTGKYTLYQLITMLFIFYALTTGKADMKKLDVIIKQRVMQMRGEIQ